MRRRPTELYWAIAAVFESLSCRALKLFRDGTSTSRSERPFERPTTRFVKNIVVKCAKSFLALAGKASLIMRWLLLRTDLVGDRGATWGLMDKLINSRSFWNLYICMRSPRVLLSSRDVRPQTFSLSTYGRFLREAGIFVTRLWTL